MTTTSLIFAAFLFLAPQPQAYEEMPADEGPVEVVTPPPAVTIAAPGQARLCRLRPCPANYPCLMQPGGMMQPGPGSLPMPPQVVSMPAPPRIYKNPRSDRPLGLNFEYAGPALFGLTATYFLTPTIQLEAGLGPITRFFGATYHFDGHNPRKLWTPYIGLSVVDFHNLEPDGGDDGMGAIYIPFGVQYSGRGGLTFAVEGAWAHLNTGDGDTLDVPWFGIKVGYRF